MTGPAPDFRTVHAPLAWWARHTPDALALDDGHTRLSFAALAARVATQAAALDAAATPTVAWASASASPADQLASFLAILASNRTAAVGDPDWPEAVRDKVQARMARHLGAATGIEEAHANTPFYIGFTSGSTGVPKGFRRTHGSWTHSFEICVQSFGPATGTTVLVPGRLSHSLFLFGALLGLWTGAGMRLQRQFSAAAALETLQRGLAGSLVAVPSQLLLMLEHAQRHGLAPVTGTRLVMISGAPWPRARTAALRALFPEARIVEFYGASETSFIAWADSDEALPDDVVGRPFANVELRIEPPLPGLIYVRSPMVFSDYVTLTAEEDGTAVLRDGDWLSVRDMGHVDEDGFLHLVGRQQRMLLVQGKNLFPEEVENVLAGHPAIAAASIQGLPHPLRGMEAVALLALSAPLSREELQAWCRDRLEPFKLPRRFYRVDAWPRTPSGKTDHAALARRLADTSAAPWERL
jgi:long-chain acyl-CoA synthetase